MWQGFVCSGVSQWQVMAGMPTPYMTWLQTAYLQLHLTSMQNMIGMQLPEIWVGRP